LGEAAEFHKKVSIHFLLISNCIVRLKRELTNEWGEAMPSAKGAVEVTQNGELMFSGRLDFLLNVVL
jgi:hypothetical protein